jgi:ion channel
MFGAKCDDQGELPVRRDIGTASGRHLALLISLLLLFILSPFVVTLRFGVVLLNLAGVAVLLSGTYAVSERKRLFAVTVILAVASVVLSGLILVLPGRWIVLTGHTCLLLSLGLFSVSILASVLRAGKITADKIYGASCVYLLVGYAWAFGYAIIEEPQPGSFSGPAATNPVDYITLVMQMRYFSFITLTTVGYGDIVPQSPAARTFATLEAVVGRIYLAVLVARLVGLHIVHANSSQSSKEK